MGNIPAPPVTAGGRGFQVANNDDFVNLAAALGRSCDVQVIITDIYKADHMLTFVIRSTINVQTAPTAEAGSKLATAIRKTPSVMHPFRRDSMSRQVNRNDKVDC